MELEVLREDINKIDRQMVELYEKRLNLMKDVAQYKKDHGLPVLNVEREEQVITQNIEFLKNKDYIDLYRDFIQLQMDQGKKLQLEFISNIRS